MVRKTLIYRMVCVCTYLCTAYGIWHIAYVFFHIVSDLSGGRGISAPPTFTAGIRLHELFLGACLFEFGGQPSQLRENLVHQANFRSQVIFVDVESQMATDEA